jgi:arylsulfatase A-like enzyme
VVRCLTFVATLAWLVGTRPALHAQPDRSKPNVVVILVEDLGYGDLGCFGQKTLKTPRLDRMANEGVRFTQFYAGNALCSPSRYTLLCGKHAGKAPIRGEPTQPLSVGKNEPTVASMLKRAGYATACFGKWGVGSPDSPSNPNDVGFDTFFGSIQAEEARDPYPEFLVRDGRTAPLRNKRAEGKKLDYAPKIVADEALAFMRTHSKQPFFLLLSIGMPHPAGKDKGPEVENLGEYANAEWPDAEKAYAAWVRDADQTAGRVIDLLKELKIDERTLVLFTSTNGPSGEGGHQPDFFKSTGKHRGGKGDPYEGGIRVPTIAWWPGAVQGGTEDILQWYGGDLLATAAELAGIDPPTGLDSDSFLSSLRGKASEDRWRRRSPLYWECHIAGRIWQVVRFGKWKAIRSPFGTGEILLYDMSNDVSEKSNYAIRRPDLAKHAANLLTRYHQPDPNWKTPMMEKK